MFSPERWYALALVSPVQKHDCCETVVADDRASGILSPAHASRLQDNPRRTHARKRSVTLFEPFSFEERDAARRAERERRLEELRQDQLRFSAFKANPVRRYKPLQPLKQSQANLQAPF